MQGVKMNKIPARKKMLFGTMRKMLKTWEQKMNFAVLPYCILLYFNV